MGARQCHVYAQQALEHGWGDSGSFFSKHTSVPASITAAAVDLAMAEGGGRFPNGEERWLSPRLSRCWACE